MSDLEKYQAPTQNLPAKIEFANALSRSGMLPKQYQGNPANLLFALEYADMLGVPPMQAITGVHVIEGKPSASAGLISALVRRAGHKLRVQSTDTKATAMLVRADDPTYTFEVVWTIERAKAAGLAGKAVWKQYPAAMLAARAITEVCRLGAEDALMGVRYTPEELGAQVAGPEGDVIEGTLVTHADAPAVESRPHDPVYVKREVLSLLGGDTEQARALWASLGFPEGRLTPEQREEALSAAKDAAAAIAAIPAQGTKPGVEDDMGPVTADGFQISAIAAYYDAKGYSETEIKADLWERFKVEDSGDLTVLQADELLASAA